MRMLHNSIVGNGRDEGQSTLRTNDYMFEDIKTILVVYKRIKAVAGGILYLVFPLYPLFKCLVCIYPAGNVLKLGKHFSVACSKRLPRFLTCSIQFSTIRENHLNVRNSLVRVLTGSAAHSAGIVCSNSSNHCRIN